MYSFEYDQLKDNQLKEARGISFDEIIMLITKGHLLNIIMHPNFDKYPNQKIYVVDIDDYVWLVLYVQNDERIFLKTAFPSRKYTKQYKRGKNVKKFR